MGQPDVVNEAPPSGIEHEPPPSPRTSPSTHEAVTVPRLRKMRTPDPPPKRPSIRVLLKQRSQETSVATRDDAQPDADEASAARRNVSVPKLHHQLSLVLNRAIGHESSSAPQPRTVSPEEQIKVHRYERMMDRFQLRRVPVGRTASGASATGGGSNTHREVTQFEAGGSWSGSRRNSMDGVPGVLAMGAETSRRNSRSTHSVYAGAVSVGDVDSHGGSRRPSVQPSSHQGSATLSSATAKRRSLPTFAPTGTWTRARLLVLVVVFAAQLVYMPYGIVYNSPSHPTAVALDSTVDGVFLLNVVATVNTAAQTNRGQQVTSRRAIWRHYRLNGIALDVLAAAPFELILQFVDHAPWLRWVVHVAQIVLQYLCVHRHLSVFQVASTREAIRTDKSLLAWILYSRYSSLVRIGGIILLITLMAHYFACIWSNLLAQVDPTLLLSSDPFELHMDSMYEALQLLQGQGVATTTPGQAVFCSIVVLLGSIVLAVVFGHVAILVSNFSANQTTYQRKMERVFAIMGKLQLPHPIRERVHQYYEYLHAEYESLDGEIVKFAKDLSHTLELEVVLFKYMDVVMHVPHWRECTPDFQKQLVLNLNVRVYLPDDFIMRRGEVGTECYIINRGTCKQHEYATGNYEPPTLPMISEEEDSPLVGGSHGRRSSLVSARGPMTERKAAKTVVRPMSRYSVAESARSDLDPVDAGLYSRVTVLKRGQAIGDMSLLANYERSSDLRAVTYVEMCVIERDAFQRILTRYPRDREIVINSIVHHTMLHLAAERLPCMLMPMVHEVQPHASVSAGIKMVAKGMNPRENDPSVVFGVTGQLSTRLQEIVARGDVDVGANEFTSAIFSHGCDTTSAAGPDLRPLKRRQSFPAAVATPPKESELVCMMQDIQERLARIEESHQRLRQSLHDIWSGRHGPMVRRKSSRWTKPNSLSALAKLQRRHSAMATRSSVGRGEVDPLDLSSVLTLLGTVPSQGLNGDVGDESAARAQAAQPLSTPKRLLQELVGTLWSRSADIAQEPASPTPWADQLFQSKRRPRTPGKMSRGFSLRRTHST